HPPTNAPDEASRSRKVRAQPLQARGASRAPSSHGPSRSGDGKRRFPGLALARADARRLQMLFPALGLTAAIWLVVTPLLGIEVGFRADLAVAAGLLAVVLLPVGVWFRKASAAAAAVGIFLGVANFVLDAPIGAYASLATCAV